MSIRLCRMDIKFKVLIFFYYFAVEAGAGPGYHGLPRAGPRQNYFYSKLDSPRGRLERGADPGVNQDKGALPRY